MRELTPDDIAGAAIVLIAMVAFVLGIFMERWERLERMRRDPLSLDGLAERADVNGAELVQRARALRDLAEQEYADGRREVLLHTAARMESVAVEHLQCINAISIESLQAVGHKAPVHLGDFTGVERRRNPPLRPVPRLLIRGGRSHE